MAYWEVALLRQNPWFVPVDRRLPLVISLSTDSGRIELVPPHVSHMALLSASECTEREREREREFCEQSFPTQLNQASSPTDLAEDGDLQTLEEFEFPYDAVAAVELALSTRSLPYLKPMEENGVASLQDLWVPYAGVGDVGVHTRSPVPPRTSTTSSSDGFVISPSRLDHA